MKQAGNRVGMVAGLAMLVSVAMGCVAAVGEPTGELGDSCEYDADCLSGICDDASGAGAVCLHDVQGDVLVSCLRDDGSLACPEDPWAELRFVRTIDGSLQVGFLTEPSDVVLPNLREVTGSVVIGESGSITHVELDGLVAVGDRMEIGFSSATTVSLARLERVESSFTLASMNDVTEISTPSLESVGNGGDSALSLWLLPSLVELDVTALEYVDGDLVVTDVPLLPEGARSVLGAVEVTGTREIEAPRPSSAGAGDASEEVQ